ncbi:hypothetical protein [Litorisediminicola beolgyonensis]|uniref:Uncharacterized protein n=1 Tax=Litorisediminicola beolgyonensis TaxID=1173614 RepID=A0ABW3ZIP7_9RHOB
MTDAPNLALTLTLAGQALAKIDRAGPRGASYVTYAEIEAMAAVLASVGLPAIQADQTIDDPRFLSSEWHPDRIRWRLAEIEERDRAAAFPTLTQDRED